jgi:hypothetical protein
MATEIGRSVGWLSEIENSTGTARLTEQEFNRIVFKIGGDKDRYLFRTWVANQLNSDRVDRSFDGAVLKYLRIKKGMTLREALLEPDYDH